MVTLGTTNFPFGIDSHSGGDPFGFAAIGSNLQTSLSAAHSASATTLNVVSNAGFPTRGYLAIGTKQAPTVIASYTGVSGTTQFTGVTLFVQDTVSRGLRSGETVASIATAATINAILAAIEAIERDRVFGPNLIMNPCGLIDQRVGPYTSTSSRNNDGKFTLDGCILLSDGNNIAQIERDTTLANLPSGTPSAFKLTVTTANKKFGVAFPLTANQAAKIIGGTASVCFDAKTATSHVVNNIRAALLSWAGTADQFTRDVVNSTNWQAQGSTPTFATSYTAENTPSNLALTTSWQTFTIENIAVDTASAANCVLFIWVDDTDCAIGDILYLTKVNLGLGTKAAPIRLLHEEQEKVQCDAWLQKYGGSGNTLVAYGGTITTTIADFCMIPRREFRATPVVDQWSAADYSVQPSTGGIACATVGIFHGDARSLYIRATVAAGLTAGVPCALLNNTASSSPPVIFSAEPGV